MNWIKNEMIVYPISELMLATLIQKYNKNYFIFDPLQEREINWNFTGCQMPCFMIVLIFLWSFLGQKMFIFEE